MVDLGARRLVAQRLEGEPLGSAAAVVAHLGAVQSQDYAVSRWSIGQRAAGVDEAAVDAALAAGEILRTHVLRDTWHLVARDDLRWLLALTAPRILARNATMHRREGLDDATLARGAELLADALRGGRQLARPALAAVLADGGIADPAGFRLAYLVMHAELTGVICSGVPDGKRHTYALLDERAPATALPDRREALARLARRYLAGHGPAMPEDLARWATLTLTDAREAMTLADARPEPLPDGRTVFAAAGDEPPARRPPARAHLLQVWDEYVNGFLATRDAADPDGLMTSDRPAVTHVVIHDGAVVGRWRRSRLTTREIAFEVEWPRTPTAAQDAAVGDAMARYAAFTGRALVG